MSITLYGYAIETSKDGSSYAATASKECDEITIHDLAGFLGSWKAKEGTKFFSGENAHKEACLMAIELTNSNPMTIRHDRMMDKAMELINKGKS